MLLNTSIDNAAVVAVSECDLAWTARFRLADRVSSATKPVPIQTALSLGNPEATAEADVSTTTKKAHALNIPRVSIHAD